MRLAKLILIMLLVAAATAGVAATQERGPQGAACALPPPPPCPKVAVECVDTGMIGAPLTFKAKVTGGNPNVKPSFEWDVPGLVIFGGQGTDTITVEPTLTAGAFKATVRVGGCDRSCACTAECTTSIIADPPARKVGEYENVPPDVEKALLDELAVELKNDPTALGMLICYGGRKSSAGEARRTCGRAAGYLMRPRGVPAPLIVKVDGGFREVPTVETWVMAAGVIAPQVSPTVDPSEVRPPKSARRAPGSRRANPRRN